MKLAVVGGRDFTDYSLLVDTLITLGLTREDTIISGGAKGADTLAHAFARSRGTRFIEHLPDWEAHGRSAGYIRNVLIVDDCDKLIAFWNGSSKGTKHSIDLAKSSGKLLKIVYYT